MIWLTWRQLRTSAAIVLGALALAAVALAVTGPQLAELLRVSGEDFFGRLGNDSTKRAVFVVGTGLAYAAPAIVGAFWGAPMVARELEAGTHRLVWNQGITRTRWLGAKLGIAAVGVMVAGSIGLVLTWWAGPLDEAVLKGYTDNGPFSVPRLWPDVFGSRGVVPIAMAVLSLVIGVAAGLVVRRTVAAMAVTLATTVALQVLMPVLVQSRLMSPETLTTELSPANLKGFMISDEPGAVDKQIEVEVGIEKPGAWVTENRTLGPDGDVLEYLPAWAEACAPGPQPNPTTAESCFTRLADEGYRQEVRYHPASRFWTMQWRETGILLLLSAAVTGFCFWRIRRDFS